MCPGFRRGEGAAPRPCPRPCPPPGSVDPPGSGWASGSPARSWCNQATLDAGFRNLSPFSLSLSPRATGLSFAFERTNQLDPFEKLVSRVHPGRQTPPPGREAQGLLFVFSSLESSSCDGERTGQPPAGLIHFWVDPVTTWMETGTPGHKAIQGEERHSLFGRSE